MRMGDTVVSNERKGMEVELKTEEKRNKSDDGSSSSVEVVRWEKFLPRMVLRVLLVEADDSTRQIITALLRKCSYRVAAVPDGLKAWETLKGRPHNIDLILTELDLPSISGYALLTLVMEHEICKNIPVIMMSSQDSVSMVFKCMLKGAADFLIKPVRKNELRNLWQHVWRRQNLTVGAGDGSEKVNNDVHKVEASSENNGASNQSSGCRASKEENGEHCEKRRDAQSFCTGHYLEAESACMQTMQGHSQIKRRNPDLIQPDEVIELGRHSVIHKRVKEDKANTVKSDVRILNETCNTNDLQLLTTHACARTMTWKGHSGTESCKRNTRISQDAHGCDRELKESSNGAIDLISSFDDHPQGTYRKSSIVDEKDTLECPPQLELSLKRYCPSSERVTLNHSDSSPFSRRYDNSKVLPYPSSKSTHIRNELKEDESKSHQILSKRNSGSSNCNRSMVDNGQENVTESCFSQFYQAEVLFTTNQLGFPRVHNANVDHFASNHAHVLQPMFYSQASQPQGWNSREASLPRSTSINSNPEMHSSEQVGHLTDETVSNTVDQTLHYQEKLKPEEQVKHGLTANGQTGASLYSGVEDHTKSSISDSNHDQPGPLAVHQTAEKVTTPESLNDGSSLFTPDGSSGIDCPRPSQREAALMKFRMKRKDRCFEKKVRYQSRKRLAEQRPRVKGQFVRQVQTDPAANVCNPSSSNS